MTKFAANEIVELGVQIEVNGREFYAITAKKSKNSKAKEIFEYLAGEEEKHITKFRGILASVQDYEPREAYPEEYFSYMNTLASDYVFTRKNKGAEIAKSIKDEREAVGLGIKAEKDSISFYEGMKKFLQQKGKETIDRVIEEEKEHEKKLTALKEIL